MTIFFPSTTDTIDLIREAIGRNIIIDTVTLSGCYNCSLDPVTNESNNAFCNVCGGKYWITLTTPHTIKAHVSSGKIDNLNWVPGGQLMEGDCVIQVKYTEEINSYVLSGVLYHIDGRDFIKDTHIYRGVPEINRIIVNLKEKD